QRQPDGDGRMSPHTSARPAAPARSGSARRSDASRDLWRTEPGVAPSQPRHSRLASLIQKHGARDEASVMTTGAPRAPLLGPSRMARTKNSLTFGKRKQPPMAPFAPSKAQNHSHEGDVS